MKNIKQRKPRQKKAIAGLIRLHKWQLNERRRNLLELESTRDMLRQRLITLKEEIKAQQSRAIQTDLQGLSFHHYTEQMIMRRKNVEKSLVDIENSLGEMRDQIADTFQELKKYQVIEKRQIADDRAEQDSKNQEFLDEISLNMHNKTDTFE